MIANYGASLTGTSTVPLGGRDEAQHAGSVAEEPDVGNPQVRFCEGHGLSLLIINEVN